MKTPIKFNLRLTEEQKAKLEKLADDRECSIAQVVREALRQYLNSI